jgi:hypothetical protein
MPRKPTKPDDHEQSKRFIDTAEEVGADTDDAALERAFKKISPLSKQQKQRGQDDQERNPSPHSRDDGDSR